jgi:hypothetical protein
LSVKDWCNVSVKAIGYLRVGVNVNYIGTLTFMVKVTIVREAWNKITQIDKEWSKDIQVMSEGTVKIKTIYDGWNALAAQIHEDNVAKGFWPGGVVARNVGELLALVHSELSEAYEAYLSGELDDKLTDFPGFDVEVADAMIRLMDAGAAYGIDITLGDDDPYGIDRFTSVESDLMTAHALVSSALEANRKGNKDSFNGTIRGAFFHLVALCGKYHINLDVIDLKLAYNRSRPFMHGKKY